VRIHEGVAIGDDVTIGAETVVMPGVRIYPYKEVESGSHIQESLIWESRASTRLFGRDGVAGLVNVDLTPEVAVRIAAALGTALKRDARVVASRESSPACRMIKRAMITGFTSAGLVGYGFWAAPFLLPLLLGPLGVEAVSAHGFTTERSDPGSALLREAIGQVKQLVPAVRADLGVVLDRAAERLYLVDEQGREIPV